MVNWLRITTPKVNRITENNRLIFLILCIINLWKITWFQKLTRTCMSKSEFILFSKSSEVSLKHCAKSKVRTFMKVVHVWKLLTIFTKTSILDVWQGSEYVFDSNQKIPDILAFTWCDGLNDFVPMFHYFLVFCNIISIPPKISGGIEIMLPKTGKQWNK